MDPTISAEEKPHLSSKNIVLLVEDQKDDAYIINNLLLNDKQRDFAMIHITSLKDLSQQLTLTPDVVLLDLGLENTQGLDTLVIAKKVLGQCPIVVLTGVDDIELGEEAIRMGAQDYLPKAEMTANTLSRTVRFAIERFSLIKAIENNSHIDSLTLMNNRAAFDIELKKRVDCQRRYGGNFAVFFMDLDKFKPVNDTYGHAIGDDLLKQIGQRFKFFSRKSDFVARIGGDEFVLIIPAFETRQELEKIAKDKIHLIAKPFYINHADTVVELTIGVSIGVAMSYAERPLSGEQLVHDADTAMYKAKRSTDTQYTVAESTCLSS